MKKFLSVVLVLVIGTALTFGMAYAIDRNRMKSGNDVVFSTWGNEDYTAKSEAKTQDIKKEEDQSKQFRITEKTLGNPIPSSLRKEK